MHLDVLDGCHIYKEEMKHKGASHKKADNK